MNELAETESAVLRMSAGGMTHGEIAFALDMPASELDNCIAEILSKFDAPDTETAINEAEKAGLLRTEL